MSEITINDITNSDIENVTMSDIYSYLNYVARNRNNSTTTRARKISSLRSFYKYCNKVGVIKSNPTKDLDSPKIKKSLPRYLNLEESISLLKAIDGKNKERDFAIVLMFLNCGMRLSELVNLDVSDIKHNYVNITGKGNKERQIYLSESCKIAIDNYVDNVRNKIDGVIDKNALFLSAQRKRIDEKTVQAFIKKYIKKAGLDETKYSVHKLRHTAATMMYRNGVDLRVLQEILGHTNLGTTQIYTHVDNESLKDASDKNPLSKFKL